MKKIKLQFMVDPEELLKHAYVPNAVHIKVVNPEAIYITGILGESGRALVKAGCWFFFTKKLADKFVKDGTAIADQKEINRVKRIRGIV